MSDFKDHFSTQSKGYGKFRPSYPEALYHYLADLCQGHERAWDCATGTGQAARGLSGFFDHVVATDGSAEQISQAAGPDNVSFRTAFAAQSGLEPESIDLITVAQALHWFDLEAFYQEVRRVLKPGGILAVWCYNLLKIDEEIDLIITRFDQDIVGEYWPPERQLVRNDYATMAFPFEEIGEADSGPKFNMASMWALDDLIGYLATWSSVAAYKAALGHDPLHQITEELTAAWGAPRDKKRVIWPLSYRIGRR